MKKIILVSLISFGLFGCLKYGIDQTDKVLIHDLHLEQNFYNEQAEKRCTGENGEKLCDPHPWKVYPKDGQWQKAYDCNIKKAVFQQKKIAICAPIVILRKGNVS